MALPRLWLERGFFSCVEKKIVPDFPNIAYFFRHTTITRISWLRLRGDSLEPKVYSISDVKDILGISRTKAYEFIRRVYEDKKPFRVLKIGDNYRIVKSSFDNWLDGAE